MIDFSKPVATRDGRAVRILADDIESNEGYPIAAAVRRRAAHGEDVRCYRKDGRLADSRESVHDLVNIKTKHEGWLNLYRIPPDSRTMPSVGGLFATEDDAHHASYISGVGTNRVACVKIEWEE